MYTMNKGCQNYFTTVFQNQALVLDHVLIFHSVVLLTLTTPLLVATSQDQNSGGHLSRHLDLRVISPRPLWHLPGLYLLFLRSRLHFYFLALHFYFLALLWRNLPQSTYLLILVLLLKSLLPLYHLRHQLHLLLSYLTVQRLLVLSAPFPENTFSPVFLVTPFSLLVILLDQLWLLC